MNHLARPSGRPASRGFTLVEILIVVAILGVLAALVVPKFSNAQSVAKASSLRNELRQFRTQVMVYRAQHGVSPGHPDGDVTLAPDYATLVAQLTQYTSKGGSVSPVPAGEHHLGPYLPRIPMNPINFSDKVLFIGAGQPLPVMPQGDAGWMYQPSTLTLLANTPGTDEYGTAYFDY